MRSGPQRSATVARRRRGSGLAVAVGRLGRCASWAAARGAGLPSGAGPRLAVVLGGLEVVLG
jgi:hypothetical protein